MQIDRLNHLQFPPDSQPAAAGKEPAPLANGTVAARPKPPTLVERAERPTPSVVLRIQADSAQTVDAAKAEPTVYTDQRKNAIAPSDEKDTEQKAREHQTALDRNSGVLTRMSVDKDGVLVVSKPAAAVAAAAEKPKDFVSAAVIAMRDFADEAERMNSQASAGKLRGLQQLAARFKVFA